MKRLLADEQLCSGCRACLVACASGHGGGFAVASARLRVDKIEPAGIDHLRVCHLCGRAPCVAACPHDALSRDPRTRAILVDAARCVPCPSCREACPFGVVAVDARSGVPLICDLCDGTPACIARCATGALRYGESRRGAPVPRRIVSRPHGIRERAS